MLLPLLLACAPAEPPERPETPDTGAAEDRPITLDPSTRPAILVLSLAEPDPALPRGAELSGLVTGLLELGLADLDGLAPEVEGLARSPGLQGALQAEVERWTLRTRMVERGQGLTLTATLCTAGGACTEHASEATRAEPTPAVAEILAEIAEEMGRGEEPGSALARAEPQSDDLYAVLLAGRSAASWYGLLPPTPENLVGNKRRDPVTRALLVDPDTALGNWVAGRRALALEKPEEARARFAAASFARPSSTLLMADEAAALMAAGHGSTAWHAWKTVLERRPGDTRFVLPAARAALAAELPGETETMLAALPAPWSELPDVLALRVAALDSLGRSAEPEFDALLARWAQQAPQDPEPVRRRMHLAAREGRYEDALALTTELGARGDAEAAAGLEAALLNALERPAPGLTPVDSPRARVTRARDLADAGAGEAALALATATLQADPWLPEALDAQAAALDALGRASEAEAARRRLCESDPGFAGCSVR